MPGAPARHIEARTIEQFATIMDKMMADIQSKDPLHGITLEMILTQLVEQYGWENLGARIPIQCFRNDPSIKSSLKFLRRTPWARKKVEELYLHSIKRTT